MTKIRTVIVDDEPLARRSLRLLLEQDPEIEIIAECRNGGEAISALRSFRPELLFLDIQMPEIDGFDVIAEVGADQIQAIIFVTAFDQYALKAFEVHALDYLLKPFDDDRFRRALAKAKAQIEQRQISRIGKKLLALLEDREQKLEAHKSKPYLSRLMIKLANRVMLLNVGDVDWIEADGNYAKLHVGNKSHLLREKMHDLESQLDPNKFVRIHRSMIVNLERIREMRPHFNGDYIVVLKDGTQLKLSRSRREHLESRLRGA